MTVLTSRFKDLLADRHGNFGAMTAILLPVLLGIAGVAMDYTSISQERNRLQDATDSAALAAASALADKGLSTEQARAMALRFLRGQMSSTSSFAEQSEEESENPNGPFSSAPEVTILQLPGSAGGGKKYSVEIKVSYTAAVSPFTRVLGIQNANIGAYSKTISQTGGMSALSMFLVLDKSGSMKDPSSSVAYTYDCSTKRQKKTCSAYYTKLESLKMAVDTLTTTLNNADTADHRYVRTGAVSYNNQMQTPSELAWGTSAALTYVQALSASGMTDSSAAFKAGYDRLVAPAENAAHYAKTTLVPKKYIVLMTDGENNQENADSKTEASCTAAKAAGVIVYSVAFMAPDRGKELLTKCASSPDHYFAAENTAQLVQAFQTIGEDASSRLTRLTN